VAVEIVDRDGARVKYAEHVVLFEISGPGDLLAVGSPDPQSEALYTGPTCKAFDGRLMAVVRSTGGSGDIVLKASTEGLAPAEISISVE
jgi:beta-galactosidase